ncbi:MAG: protein kinase [bacterium]|nr:protein kinase [bacterium]
MRGERREKPLKGDPTIRLGAVVANRRKTNPGDLIEETLLLHRLTRVQREVYDALSNAQNKNRERPGSVSREAVHILKKEWERVRPERVMPDELRREVVDQMLKEEEESLGIENEPSARSMPTEIASLPAGEDHVPRGSLESRVVDGQRVMELSIPANDMSFPDTENMEFLLDLRDANPFGIRAWTPEIEISGNEAPLVSGSNFAFPVFRQLRVKGVVYNFTHLADGGMGAAYKGVSEDGEKEIILKVMLVHDGGPVSVQTLNRETSALRETSLHSVMNPSLDEVTGESSSGFARAVRAAGGRKPEHDISDHFPKFIDTMLVRVPAGEVKLGRPKITDRSQEAYFTFMSSEGGHTLKDETNGLLEEERGIENRLAVGPRNTAIHENKPEQEKRLSGVVDIAIQLHKAMRGLEKRGIVHRDIKPENIVRKKDGTISLIDFGIAEGEIARGFEELGERFKFAHEKIVNDAKGLYAAVKVDGLLLPEQQKEIWAVLGQVDKYQHGAELSPAERAIVMQKMVPKMDTLVNKYYGKIIGIESLHEGNTRWNKRDWTDDQWDGFQKLRVEKRLKVLGQEEDIMLETGINWFDIIQNHGGVGEQVKGTPKYLSPQAVYGERVGHEEDMFQAWATIADISGMAEFVQASSVFELLSNRAKFPDAGIAVDGFLYQIDQLEEEVARMEKDLADLDGETDEYLVEESDSLQIEIRNRKKEIQVRKNDPTGWLLKLMKRGIAKNPKDRPKNAQAVLDGWDEEIKNSKGEKVNVHVHGLHEIKFALEHSVLQREANNQAEMLPKVEPVELKAIR